MVRFSHAEPPGWRQAVAAASATAPWPAVSSPAALCVLAGLLLPGYLCGAASSPSALAYRA